MRRLEEFYCTECHQYFKTYLRTNMTGNYTIECPNPLCHHHHFRVIKQGLVTEDRHSRKYGDSEIILGLESTLSKTPWHDSPEFKRSQMRLLAAMDMR